VTAPDLFSRNRAVVKAHLVQTLSVALDELLDAAFSGALTARGAEQQVWTLLLSLGRLVMTAVFAAMCRRATEASLEAAARTVTDVKMRLDKDYWFTIVTTLGRVRVPWFAYRDGERICVPARALFPLQGTCVSSEVCLEWETALASDHPFRKAATALGFFTHGAVDLSDTTLERHAVRVGTHIAREWLYQTPAQIREVLQQHATRDLFTGRPLIYASTDAHALRRFVDETWASPWKMINGIRLWCIDKATGEMRHLGGEYTWGDCHEVAARFVALQQSGHLPADGHYGDGLVAQLVLPTDGSPWIAEHVLPLFPGAMRPLDPYHVVEQVADAAKKAFPRAPKKVKQLVAQARRAIGMKEKRSRAKHRKGQRKQRHKTRHPPFTGSAQVLLELLRPIARTLEGAAFERFQTLVAYVARNQDRMSYGEMRTRGLSIGSGAMESLHRTASQMRLKRSGCRWTPGVAIALLNARLLALAGRWDAFWGQPDLAAQLAAAEEVA
jgi:hypothetical protein